MTERLTEEQIDRILAEYAGNDVKALKAQHRQFERALRQVREDLELSRAHHDATLDDLDAARKRIAELEATMAELSRLGSYVSYKALANLPAAVQRHVARDRAAEDMAIRLMAFLEAVEHSGFQNEITSPSFGEPFVAATQQALAAYRAAGGEE